MMPSAAASNHNDQHDDVWRMKNEIKLVVRVVVLNSKPIGNSGAFYENDNDNKPAQCS